MAKFTAKAAEEYTIKLSRQISVKSQEKRSTRPRTS